MITSGCSLSFSLFARFSALNASNSARNLSSSCLRSSLRFRLLARAAASWAFFASDNGFFAGFCTGCSCVGGSSSGSVVAGTGVSTNSVMAMYFFLFYILKEIKQTLMDHPEIKAPPPEPIEIVTKKRKRCSPDELQALKKEAQCYCKTYDEYKAIRNYKRNRLEQWIEEKKFDQDHNLSETIFDAIHNVFAATLDMLTRGEGYVKDELLNDLTLRQAIEDEGRGLLKFLSNRYRILALTGSDTYHGKLKQRKETQQQVDEYHQEANDWMVHDSTDPEEHASCPSPCSEEEPDQAPGIDLAETPPEPCDREKRFGEDILADQPAENDVEGSV